MPPLRPFRRGAGAKGPTVEEWAEEFSLAVERNIEFGQLLFGGPQPVAVGTGGNNHTHGTVAATNVTLTSASSGLSISVAAPGAGGGIVLWGGGAGGGFITSGTAWLTDSYGVSLYRTNQTIYGSHDGLKSSLSTNLLYTSQSSLFQHTSATSVVTSAAQHTSLMSNYAAASVSQRVVSFNGTSGSISLNAGSNLSLSQGAGASASAFTLNVTGALTTAMASDAGSRFLNTGTTGATNCTLTLASNSLAISVGNYLTTAANSTHSHGNPTLALTNLTGTTASASNGLTLSLSAADPSGGAALQGSGTYTQNSGTIQFANSNGVTFGLTNNQMTASMNPAAYAGFSQFHQGIGYAGWGARPLLSLITHASAVNTRPIFIPFVVPGNLTANELHYTVSQAATASNILYTLQVGLYTFVNSSSIALLTSTQVNYSVSDTASFSGIKAYECPMPQTTMSPGHYVLGLNFSAANTGSMNFSLMGGATTNVEGTVIINSGSNQYQNYTSHGRALFFGRYTANSAGMPANVTVGQYIAGPSAASLPIPIFADLWNHV